MKRLLIAAAIAGFSSGAWAGNLAEPTVEPPVEEVTMEKSSGAALPLILLLAVAVAAAALS